MEYMDAQMQNHIEAGISENERLHLVNKELATALNDTLGCISGPNTSPQEWDELEVIIRAALKHAGARS